MNISEIKKVISEAVRLIREQKESILDVDPEYCDSLCCAKAYQMLEELLDRL
jgi:hypothetical protein